MSVCLTRNGDFFLIAIDKKTNGDKDPAGSFIGRFGPRGHSELASLEILEGHRWKQWECR